MDNLHSPKLQHYWSLTIRLFRVISRRLVERGCKSKKKRSRGVSNIYQLFALCVYTFRRNHVLDYTNLFFADRNYHAIFQKMKNLQSLTNNCLSANSHSLNVDKIRYTPFLSSSVENDLNLEFSKLYLGSKEFKRSRYEKFLGILIDENLNWKLFIQTVESKLSWCIGIICCGRRFLSKQWECIFLSSVHI